MSAEGDRKAYYENAEYTMKQNREKITKLRHENNDLYKEKAKKLKVCSVTDTDWKPVKDIQINAAATGRGAKDDRCPEWNFAGAAFKIDIKIIHIMTRSVTLKLRPAAKTVNKRR